MQALSTELSGAAIVKRELLDELSRVRDAHHDTLAEIETSAQLLTRVETTVARIEQRRADVTSAERTVAAVEAHVGELTRIAETVRSQIDDLSERQALV